MLRRTLRAVALAMVALPALAALAPALAQSATPAGTAPSGADAAFDAVLEDPGNLEKNLAYATALVKEGDLEGAIAVLERLVLIYPDRAELHLSLGQLYRRAGSDAAAARAFDNALAAPITSPEVKAEAEAGRKAALKATAASQFGGSLFAGLQYQTNANGGPDSHSIWSGGTLIDRADKDRPDDDVTGVLGFNLNHRYDFGRQSALALESRLTGFGQLYADNERFDTARIGAQVGLGFNPFPGDGGFFRLTPRVNGEAAFTDGQFLEGGGGPGIGARFNFSDTLRLDVGYDAVYRDYDHIGALGDTQDYTGLQQDGIITLTWVPAAGTTLVASLGGRGTDADRRFLDYVGLLSSVGVYQTYGSPLRFLPADWMLGAAVGYEARWYDDPDPSVDPDVRRQDDIWQFDVSNTIPLSESWSLTQQVQYLLVDSNLRNYSYDNVTVAMSARWRF